MEAVKQSSPFKPLPEEFKGKWVAIEFTFDYNVLNNPQSANYTHPDIIYLHSVYNPLAVKQQNKVDIGKQADLKQENLPKIERKYIPSYVNSVVESNWTPPENSCTKPTVISFKIKSDGSVIDKTIIESSGCPEVDEAAMQAIEKSSPFRPLSTKKADEILSFEYTFTYLTSNPTSYQNSSSVKYVEKPDILFWFQDKTNKKKDGK